MTGSPSRTEEHETFAILDGELTFELGGESCIAAHQVEVLDA